jgi:5-methylcytosine-specific restriction endonuclease McrA
MCSTSGSLAADVGALAGIQLQTQPISALMELVETASDARRRLDGVISRAVGEIALRGGGQVPDPSCAGSEVPMSIPTAAWVRSVTGTSGNAAGRQIRTSVALRELPAVSAAVVDGEITLEHARVLARLVGRIDPQALLASQPELVEVARRTDPDQLAMYVRHLLATWCEPQLEADEVAAEDRRFLQLRNRHNGSWRGVFELPDAAMEIVLTALEPLARRAGDQDTRTAGQRRADALTDVFGLALRHGELPDTGGSRPKLTYVLPSDGSGGSARDADSASGAFTVDTDRHPGQACPAGAWTGPATRAQLQTLQCNARLEAARLDRAGQVVSLTSLTDHITAAQRRAVAARDRCCTAKGCTRPPAFCDVHHLWSLADGGPTEIGNLVLLCRRHHVQWHRQELDLSDLRVPWKRLPSPRAPLLE